jgi:peptide/nickel transport system substrate-binding protein
MDAHRAPFNSRSVRLALNLAVNRRRVVELAGGPLGAQPTCQILPPNIPGYQPDCPFTAQPSAAGTWLAPDDRRARRLVAASGTSGMRVTVDTAPTADAVPASVPIGRYLVGVLRRLGYRAALRITSDPTPYLRRPDGAQIAWFPWFGDFPDPSTFFTPGLACGGKHASTPDPLNYSGMCNSAVSAAVARARRLTGVDSQLADRLWSQADRTATALAPWVCLYTPRVLTISSRRVGDYQFHPFWIRQLDQLWVR